MCLGLSALPRAGIAFWAQDNQPRDRELRLLMHHGLSTAGSKPWFLMHEGQIALSVHLFTTQHVSPLGSGWSRARGWIEIIPVVVRAY